MKTCYFCNETIGQKHYALCRYPANTPVAEDQCAREPLHPPPATKYVTTVRMEFIVPEGQMDVRNDEDARAWLQEHLSSHLSKIESVIEHTVLKTVKM